MKAEEIISTQIRLQVEKINMKNIKLQHEIILRNYEIIKQAEKDKIEIMNASAKRSYLY